MDHSGLKLHRDTSVQQSGTNFLLYAWTKPIRDFDAFLFTKSHSVLSINFVIVHPSRPLASKNVFVCHILLVIDHTHHGSKVKHKKFLENCLISGFLQGFLASDTIRQIHWILGIDVLLSRILLYFGILRYSISQKHRFKHSNKEQHGFGRRKQWGKEDPDCIQHRKNLANLCTLSTFL